MLCQALVSSCEMMLLSDDLKPQTVGCSEQRVGMAAGKEKEKQKGKKGDDYASNLHQREWWCVAADKFGPT